MVNRYRTPLKYKDGNGKERTGVVYFELDPIELTDWTMENPFEANELRASLMELQAIEKEESRDLTQDEIRTMLGVIKLLAQISAGRPTDDGAYFLKDPNWTSSYMYKGFRLFLMTNPREVDQFLKQLLDNDVMEEFTKAINEANEKLEAEAPERSGDSNEDTIAKMQKKIEDLQRQNSAPLASDAASE